MKRKRFAWELVLDSPQLKLADVLGVVTSKGLRLRWCGSFFVHWDRSVVSLAYVAVLKITIVAT
jgi:hypothetical protein